ncbi:MAG: hypothetical protein WCP14_02545 [bacterium]
MNKQKMINGFGLGLGITALFLPMTTMAKAISVVTTQFGSSTLQHFLTSIYDIVWGVTFTIAVLVLIYGGIMYMLSAGDPTRSTTAKKILTSGLIGIAIVAGSYLLVSLIGFIIGRF